MKDRKSKKKALVVLLALAGVVLLASLLSSSYPDHVARVYQIDPALAFSKLRGIIKVSAVLVVVFVLMLSIYFLSVAVRTLRHGQYPPPGMRLRSERVRSTGREALYIGLIFIVCSGLLIAFSGYFFVLVVEGGCRF